MRVRSTHWLVLVSACISTTLQADPLPASFTLSRFVPGDCWLYVHGVDNPERHWIDEKWADIFRTAANSGIDQDIKRLLFSFMSEAQRADFEKQYDRSIEMLGKVRWGDLVRHEFVYAQCAASHGMGYDHMFLMRGAEAEGNLNALAVILREIAGLSDKLTVVRSEDQGIELYTLGTREPDSEMVNGMFWLFRRGADTIGAVFSPPVPGRSSQLHRDLLAMLSGSESKKSIRETARFREALKKVPPPSDAVTFVDWRMMFASMDRMFEVIEKDQLAQADDNARRGVAMMRTLFDKIGVVDYVITSVSTRGNRMQTDELTRLQSAKRQTPVTQMFVDRRPFERFDRYIPADARSFSFNAGIDFEKLYNTVIDIVRKEIPGGEDGLAKWNGMLASVGIDLERDFFSWYGGETISMELPAAMVTPMSSTDSILMIRVKNQEIAREKVNGVLDFVAGKMQEQGQMLMVSRAKCGDGNFREVTHPMLAMFLRPVIGVQDDWLILSTSSGAVDRCLNCAAGKSPSIKEASRFREEGLIPERPFHSLSFQDLSRKGQDMAAAAAGIGMMGGIVVGFLPPEVPPEARQMLQGTIGIIAKLAPILQKIDFYSSKSALGFMEDDLSYRSRSVTTYKRPAEPKPPADTANAAAN